MGSSCPSDDVPILANLYRQGRLELDSLISGRYPLDDVNEALDAARSGKGLRNVVIMEESLTG